MRALLSVLALCAVATAHGESGRTQPPPSSTGTQVFPTGGPTSTPGDKSGPRVTTIAETATEPDWEKWWAYNAERILAGRLRGVTISGTRTDHQEPLGRKELRARVFDILLEALEDKNHSVRASAAIALGKFGMADANPRLARHVRFPGEGWYDVREATLYGMGILGLEENRGLMRTLAGDDQQSIRARGLALVSLAFDGTEESLDLLVWHLRYKRSGIESTPGTLPHTAEEERRRVAVHMLGFAEGEKADTILLDAARGLDGDGPAVQALAVTAVGRRRVAGGADVAFRLAESRSVDREVRRSAVIALGRLVSRGDEGAIKRVARLVRDDRRDNVAQQFAVMALADIGGPGGLAALQQILAGRVFADDKDRAFLWLALGLCGDGAGETLLGELEDARTSENKAVLALACGLAREKGAVPLILREIDRYSLEAGRDVLAYGALALGLLGDPRGVDPVREILRKYNDGKVQRNAALGLTLLLRAKAVPELVATLEEAGNIYTKSACVTALGFLPEPMPEAVDALIAAFRKDSNPDTVRAMAIIALGTLGDPRAIPLSAAITAHYNYFIRSHALDEIARYL